MLYAVSSAANNNGSAFTEGLSANSPFWNCLLAFCMFVGRSGIIVPVMAIAGSLANKKIQPTTTGTLPTHGALFIGLLTGTVLLVGAPDLYHPRVRPGRGIPLFTLILRRICHES